MRPVSWRAEQKRSQDDAVFDTNGSITDNTSLGDLDTPVTEDHRYAPSLSGGRARGGSWRILFLAGIAGGLRSVVGHVAA
jgi:myosin-crossreactive antigen